MHLNHLLIEPPRSSGWWLAQIYARLLTIQEEGLEILAERGRPTLEVTRRMKDLSTGPSQLPGIGSPRPRLVIIGDRLVGSSVWPFFDRSGYHLWSALRWLGFDEIRARVVNSRTRESERVDLSSLFRHLPLSAEILVLGREAGKTLRSFGPSGRSLPVSHSLICAPHPRHALKENPDAGPVGYAESLEAAGLQRLGPPLLPAESGPDQPRLCCRYGLKKKAPVITYPDSANWPPPTEHEQRAALAEASAPVDWSIGNIRRLTTEAMISSLRLLADRIESGDLVLSSSETLRIMHLAHDLDSDQTDRVEKMVETAEAAGRRAVGVE